MKNLTDIISDSKRKEFNVSIEIQLESNVMKSEVIINETTPSYAREQAVKMMNENNIMKFDITSVTEVEAEEEEEDGGESDA